MEFLTAVVLDRHVTMRAGRADNEALALVFLDGAAMIADQAFELGIVEAAARDDERGGLVGAGRRQRCDDVINVFLDVDAF